MKFFDKLKKWIQPEENEVKVQKAPKKKYIKPGLSFHHMPNKPRRK